MEDYRPEFVHPLASVQTFLTIFVVVLVVADVAVAVAVAISAAAVSAPLCPRASVYPRSFVPRCTCFYLLAYGSISLPPQIPK